MAVMWAFYDPAFQLHKFIVLIYNIPNSNTYPVAPPMDTQLLSAFLAVADVDTPEQLDYLSGLLS